MAINAEVIVPSIEDKSSTLYGTQARCWCLTINNETMTDAEFAEYVQGLEHFKYIVFQREIGAEKGVEHIQAYIEFTIGKRFSTIKGYFPRAHIEPRKGSKAQARNYCMKTETRFHPPVEIGTFAEERARTDITTMIDMVKSGASNYDIMSLFPVQYMKMSNTIDKVRSLVLEEKYKNVFRKLTVKYIWGETAVGKTRNVMDQYGYDKVYRVTEYDAGSFDAYSGQDIILFEEFHGQFPIEKMLVLLDGYPLMLPCRYYNKVACYTKVYLTSNEPLSSLYTSVQSSNSRTYDALKRRITDVIYMGNTQGKSQSELDLELYDGDLPF